MKKTFLVAMLSLLTLAATAETVWKETCGTSVEKSGNYWPYTNAFEGYDHYGECTYDGWNSTVRYLDRYAANGPHVYFAASKDCRFSIDGIPGGANATFSFDVTCYDSNASAGTYESTDLFGLKVNEEEVAIASQTLSSSAFTTVSVVVNLSETSNKIEITKASSVAADARLDNFTVTYGTVVQMYTLTLSASAGGRVNSDVNGEYAEGTQVTIIATPNESYHFVQWSDGNTNATRTITMNSDISLRAEFAGEFNTVANIIDIYNSLGLESGATSTDSYTGRGYVTSWYNGYPNYNNADFYVDDYADGSTSLLECWRLTAVNEVDKRTLEVGEYVEFTGYLKNYNGRAEVCNGTFRVLEAPHEDTGEETCYPQFEGMTGAQILATLHEQIKDPDTLEYYYLRADKTGVDYRADYTVWDMYTNCSFQGNSYCAGVIENPDECQCYNREHMLPQSWWGNVNTKRMRTDLHHVIPTDAATNTQRSNNPYGEVSGTPTWSNAAGSKSGYGTYSTTVFEPADEYKGDIARVYFYMLTCYSDEDFTVNWKGQKVFTYTNGQAGLTAAAKALFLKWHRNDPVSEKEINRNNGVERKQHNRNPYVDMPELIEYIWGKKSSKTYTCAGPAQGIEETAHKSLGTKMLIDGQLIIELQDGARYSILGERIR